MPIVCTIYTYIYYIIYNVFHCFPGTYYIVGGKSPANYLLRFGRTPFYCLVCYARASVQTNRVKERLKKTNKIYFSLIYMCRYVYVCMYIYKCVVSLFVLKNTINFTVNNYMYLNIGCYTDV